MWSTIVNGHARIAARASNHRVHEHYSSIFWCIVKSKYDLCKCIRYFSWGVISAAPPTFSDNIIPSLRKATTNLQDKHNIEAKCRLCGRQPRHHAFLAARSHHLPGAVANWMEGSANRKAVVDKQGHYCPLGGGIRRWGISSAASVLDEDHHVVQLGRGNK